RVVVPRRVAEPWVPIDDVREALATRVLELAGEARAAAAQEDRDRVLDAVSRRAWLAAWERAVRRVAERVIEALDERIARAAWQVRMPPRRWRRRLLSTPEKRAVAARLATGGEPLVAALDALDAVAARVRDASVLDKAAHAEWQEALRGAARRLEAASLALEAGAADEERRSGPALDARGAGLLREPARCRDARCSAARRQRGRLQGAPRKCGGARHRVARDRGYPLSRRTTGCEPRRQRDPTRPGVGRAAGAAV